MSFPTTYKLWKLNIPISARISEYEIENIEQSRHFSIDKYWLDLFDSDWILEAEKLPWVLENPEIVVVSPELHGRNPLKVWEWAKQQIMNGTNLRICTDLPYELEDYLNV